MTLAALGPRASCWEPCCTAWRLRRLTHVCGRGASGAWRQRRLATAARGACGAWRAGGAWRLRRLATVVLGAIFCLGCHRDLQRPPKAPRQCFRDVARVISSRYITSGHAGRFQPAPMCYTQLLFLPLSVWFGLSRPLEASRGPNEPQISVFGMSPE